MEWLLRLADIFFLGFHTSLVLFNLLGWLWRKTRVVNLITLLLTAGSWFGLGMVYGLGYCPLTDWHWQVLHRLGARDLPHFYLQYLLERLTGLTVAATAAETVTAAAFFAALILSVILNIRDFRGIRRQ